MKMKGKNILLTGILLLLASSMTYGNKIPRISDIQGEITPIVVEDEVAAADEQGVVETIVDEANCG